MKLGTAEGLTESKRKIYAALDFAAKQLGITRNVGRKYYIHPIIIIIDHYSNNTIENYLEDQSQTFEDNELGTEEKILMKMLAEINVAMISLPGNI